MPQARESLWRSILRHPKLLLLVIGSPFFVYVAAKELATAVSERNPTQFQAVGFAGDYRGQRWLCVEGRLAVEYADVRANRYNQDIVDVHVPLVPPDWEPDQAVHVVGSFYMPRSEMQRWAATMSQSVPCTLTGMVGPLGPLRSREMFPSLHLEEPVVYIDEGGAPHDPGLDCLFLAFVTILLVASWWRFARLVFSRNESEPTWPFSS
jgi:hypothetical protein